MRAILLVALFLIGCGGNVARTQVPVGHTELTSDEYNDAEAHFAGAELSPMPPEWKGGYTDKECQDLLDKRDLLSNLNLGLGVLTGGSGLTAVIPNGMEEEKKERFQIAFGSLTLGFGVASAIMAGTIKTLSARYEKNCVTEADAEESLPQAAVVESEADAPDGGTEDP